MANISGQSQREGKALVEKKAYGSVHHSKNMGRTYAEVAINKAVEVSAKEVKKASISFNVLKCDLKRFDRAFTGKVKFIGSTYNIQNLFHVEGYFSVKVTPLMANLCLLEESDE